MAWNDGLLQFLGGGIGATIITSIANAFVNKKKVSADVADRLAQTAEGITKTLERQLKEVRRDLLQSEARHRARDILGSIHERWDRQTIRTCDRQNPPINLSEPPPLWLDNDEDDQPGQLPNP